MVIIQQSNFFVHKTSFLHAIERYGDTYLHRAAGGNEAGACKMLVKYGIDVTLLHIDKETPWDIAIRNEYDKVLNVLKVKLDMPSFNSAQGP